MSFECGTSVGGAAGNNSAGGGGGGGAVGKSSTWRARKKNAVKVDQKKHSMNPLAPLNIPLQPSKTR